MKSRQGFTIIELVLVILILGVLAVTVYTRWPAGMENRAAVLEFKRAVRYAQHKAITRRFVNAASAWGIIVSANQYTVKRANDTDFAETEYLNQSLPDDTSISNGSVWFNGLGEPIDITTPSGLPLTANTSFNIGPGSQVLVYAETGYVE